MLSLNTLIYYSSGIHNSQNNGNCECLYNYNGIYITVAKSDKESSGFVNIDIKTVVHFIEELII